MILLIDNYDSFTFNLLQYLGEVTAGRTEISVRRNDSISVEEIERIKPAQIVISPGPCTPNEAGVSLELIRRLHTAFPILGVCLGHQAIAQAFGGEIVRAKVLVYGKTSSIKHCGRGIFQGIESPLTATRYHSLILKPESCPECLEITANTEDGEIMAIAHREFPRVTGLQFHPESIMTSSGKCLLANFLAL